MTEHAKAATWWRDESGRPRTRWRLLFFVGAYLVLRFSITAINRGWIGGLTGLEPGSVPYKAWRNEHILLLEVVLLPYVAVSALLVASFRRSLDRRSLADVGLAPPTGRGLSGMLLGTVAAVLCVVFMVTLQWLQGACVIEGIQGSWSAAALAVLLLPWAWREEILFRGYLLSNCRESGYPLAGLFGTSVLFWLFHAGNDHFWDSPWVAVNLIGGSLIMGAAALWTRDIWLATGLHYGWNLGQGVLFNIPVSGIRFPSFIHLAPPTADAGPLPGGSRFGLEGSAVAALLVAVALVLTGVALLLWRIRRTCPPVQSPSSPLGADEAAPPSAPTPPWNDTGDSGNQ